MSDYRVLIKVQNGRIWEAIRKQGHKNVSAFCQVYHLSHASIGKILNLKQSPINRWGKFRSIVERLSEALNLLPEDLFTERQYEPVPSNVRDFLVEERYMAQLIDKDANSPEHQIALLEMAEGIQTRAHLTEREQKVIDSRFKEELTYKEIAKSFGVSTERVRQIEAKAFRKMRAPSVISDIKIADMNA